jgi:1-acyl-sn-glycerol-3-phosphate acyltransferase
MAAIGIARRRGGKPAPAPGRGWVSARLGRLATPVEASSHAVLDLLMRLAVRGHFGRLRVRHRERFPRRGPVLLVANHPAMWTDVVVLDVALGRKLHFLAAERLFRPFVRAALLEIHGALPVVASPGEEGRERNEQTFRRCRELFAHGEVVAVFPEGVSAADRSVLELRTGAARLALAAARETAPRRLPAAGAREAAPHTLPIVIPAGLHYASRTAFGSEVTVSVGEPIDLSAFRALEATDPEGAARALTREMRRALRALILDLPEPALAAAVADLAPLAGLSTASPAPGIESAQRLAGWLERVKGAEPGRFAAMLRHGRAYRRARHALALSDRALAWDRHAPSWRARGLGLVSTCALGAPVAAIGLLAHVVPWAVGEWVARRLGRNPARFAFGRIASGLACFPLTYLAWFTVLRQMLHAPGWLAALAVLALVPLGRWTLRYAGWLRTLAERARLARHERRHPRLLRRARAEQRLLLRLVTEAGRPAAGGPR